jgi:hypothetical protein
VPGPRVAIAEMGAAIGAWLESVALATVGNRVGCHRFISGKRCALALQNINQTLWSGGLVACR